MADSGGSRYRRFRGTRRWLLCAAVTAVGVTMISPTAVSAHSCPTQTIDVVGTQFVKTAELVRVERAVVTQARVLRRYWHTDCVRFTRGPWQGAATWELSLQTHHDQGDAGGHGGYFLHVDIAHPNAPAWSTLFSHEVMEQL